MSKPIKSAHQADKSLEYLMRGVTQVAAHRLGLIIRAVLKFCDEEKAEALQAERDAIVECIRSSSWSGTEEIVAMIKRRK